MSVQFGNRTGPVLGLIVLLALVATAAHADTLRRFVAPVTATGSEGATEYVQASATASALVGEVAPAANTAISIPFGVLGEYDASQTQFGIGVVGISTTGYGVAAEAFGSNPTMLAEAGGLGDALDAIVPNSNTANQIGVDAENDNTGPALTAIAYNGNAIEASASANQTAAVSLSSILSASYGLFATNATDVGQGIHVESTNSEGVVARSTSGSYAVPVALLEDYKTGGDVLDGFAYDSQGNFETPLRIVNPSANSGGGAGDYGGDPSVGVDVHLSGDAFVQGNIYAPCEDEVDGQTGGTYEACESSLYGNGAESPDPQIVTYHPQAEEATIEDVGDARLVNGRAHVALEPRFASIISAKQPYTVFTTANGESNGLYVTDKTPKGFDVRENGGGRSSIAFDYRIVGQPRADAQPISKRNEGKRERAPATISAQDAKSDRFRAQLTRAARSRSFYNLIR